MNSHDRLVLEETIVSAALCWQPALRIALEELPLNPFRASDGHLFNSIFYWSAAQLEKGIFDGVTNPDRLAVAFEATGDSGWNAAQWGDYLDSLWTPAQYDDNGVRALCALLRAENEVADREREQAAAVAASGPLRDALDYFEDLVTGMMPEPPKAVKKPAPRTNRGGMR